MAAVELCLNNGPRECSGGRCMGVWTCRIFDLGKATALDPIDFFTSFVSQKDQDAGPLGGQNTSNCNGQWRLVLRRSPLFKRPCRIASPKICAAMQCDTMRYAGYGNGDNLLRGPGGVAGTEGQRDRNTHINQSSIPSRELRQHHPSSF